MKVFLCNPANPELPADAENPIHPLGMLYIANYLRQHIIEKLEFKYINKDYEKEFLRFKPDLVLMTTVSSYYNISKWIAEKFKEINKRIPIIVGGYHITALPQTMTNHMDISVLREGEETMRELLPLIENPHDNIKGIAYRKNGKLKITKPRPLIKNLDSLPLPARDIVSHLIKKNEFTGMITTRGCPYTCVFCANTDFWGCVRFHSAEYVVNEIKEIAEKYTRKIVIMDDTFTINKKRLRQIAKLIYEEKLDVEINVGGRAETINDEICELLKKIGITSLMFGFESGNQRVLNYLKNERVKIEDNYRAVELCKKYDINVFASLVIGSPDETREEILETLKFAKTKGIWVTTANILTPLPGTRLWDEALKRGLVSNDMDWEKLNYNYFAYQPDHKKVVVMSNNLSRKELFDLWKKFDKVKQKTLLKAGIKDPLKGLKYIYQRMRWRLKT